jgi:hypothetical protein
MKIIEVTSAMNDGKIYVNIEHIGHIYENQNNHNNEFSSTTLGVTTHNNGGFKIKETAKQVLTLIKSNQAI